MSRIGRQVATSQARSEERIFGVLIRARDREQMNNDHQERKKRAGIAKKQRVHFFSVL